MRSLLPHTPTISLALLFAGVLGCRGDDPKPSEPESDQSGLGSDNDGDGYTTPTDCDDNAATTYPGATEFCDLKDNDCDGKIDELGVQGTQYFYRDLDSDGFGNSLYYTRKCFAPTGYVADSTDCNDSSAAINPGATEICDSLDNNCDATIDQVDDDDDGAIAAACGGPDCDDALAAVNPSATEVWYDGVDQDCDEASDFDADIDGFDSDAWGGSDCDDTAAAVSPAASEVWYDDLDQDCDGGSDWDADQDGHEALTHAGDDCDDSRADTYPGAAEVWYDGVDQACDAGSDYDADSDGYEAEAGGGLDCDDSLSAVNPEGVEVCDNGIDEDCDGAPTGCGPFDVLTVADADATLTGEAAGDRLGQGDPGFDRLGDFNGDGIDDFAVGALRNAAGGSQAGAAYVIAGPLSTDGSVASQDILKVVGAAAGDNLGRGVAGVGDVNNDGYDDLLIGAIGVDTTGTDAGAAYLVLGPATGTMGAGSSDAIFLGEMAGDIAGEIAWTGDVNGDGYDDLLIGAQYGSATGTRAGASYLFLGPETGTKNLSAADARIYGETANDEAAASNWGAGDTDGDGLADLLIGARTNDAGGADAGAAYLVLGPVSGTINLASADTKWTGPEAGAEIGAGVSLSTAGDLNNDGYADLIIGSKNDDEAFTNAGAAFVVLGPVSSGTFSLSTADAKLLGEADRDYLGDSVAPAGDVDGDGYEDVVVGSGYNDAGATNAGALYLVRGPVTGTSSVADAAGKVAANGAEDRARVRGVGDIDNDGFDDIMLGAQNNDTAGADAGAVYLFYGQGF